MEISAELVKKNIRSIFERRRAAIYALALRYAAEALNYFRREQSSGAYWVNRTNTAKDLMFSNAFIEKNVIGWFFAHGVEYGPYLELANDGRNQAIRPVINIYGPLFLKAVKELVGG